MIPEMIVLFMVLVQPGTPPAVREVPVPSIDECFELAHQVMEERLKLPLAGNAGGMIQVGCAVVVPKQKEAAPL